MEILQINTVQKVNKAFVGVRELESGGGQRVFLLCLVPVISSIRPCLVALILLFCYSSLCICFHCRSIICGSLASARHKTESHFPLVLCCADSQTIRPPFWLAEPWRGGGVIRSSSWMFRRSGNERRRYVRNTGHFAMWLQVQMRNLGLFTDQNIWGYVDF